MQMINKVKENLKDQECLRALNAGKILAAMVLRDKGFGSSRLYDFSNKFDEELEKVMRGDKTLEYIQDVITDETGLTQAELKVK